MRTIELLSIVSPAHNEAEGLRKFTDELKSVLNPLGCPYEIILVDDGSRDGTAEVIRDLAKEDSSVYGLILSKNFGHQAALVTGLHEAKGNVIVMLDSDLQHPPSVIPKLIEKWMQGFQVVQTIRESSASSGGFLKRLSSDLFYKFLSKLARLPIRPGMADFRLVDRVVLEEVLKIAKANVFLRGLFVWVGFKQATVNYHPEKRQFGESSYSLIKMMKLALAGVVTFSNKPLYWVLGYGLINLSFASLYGVYVIYISVFTSSAVPGWASTVLLILFLFGFQFIFMGLVGIYISAIFSQVNHMPFSIVAERHRQNKNAERL